VAPHPAGAPARGAECSPGPRAPLARPGVERGRRSVDLFRLTPGGAEKRRYHPEAALCL